MLRCDTDSSALSVSVVGNTLAAGGQGCVFGDANVSSLILNNNFGAATYGGIDGGGDGSYLSTAQIFSNVLNDGLTFHVQLSYSNSFGWFMGSNTYWNASSNSVLPFLDPLASSVHLTQ
jgi:hypothetical protein